MDQLEVFSEALEKLTIKDITIKKLQVLGEGIFSSVFLGELRRPDGSVQSVAVKEGKCDDDDEILQDEAEILAQLDHRNIVKLLSIQSDPLMLVLEYMDWGSLEDAVQVHEFNDSEILKSLHDIASGMEYIFNKKFIHKDLACKNVLVDSNKLCKIGDFGLSRYFGDSADGQVEEEKCIIEITTAPPESRESQIYSAKSDIWAFGILIWELYSLREEDLHYDYDSDVKKVGENGMLSRPPSYPIELFDYVKENLLNFDPEKRTDFTSVKEKIGEMLGNNQIISEK